MVSTDFHPGAHGLDALAHRAPSAHASLPASARARDKTMQ